MKNILTIICFISNLICCSQIDSIVKQDFIKIGSIELNAYTERLNEFLRPKLINISINETFNKNLISNVYSNPLRRILCVA